MRLQHDLRRDLLRFILEERSGSARDAVATIDIGEGGRLLGVEVDGIAADPGQDDWYLSISEAQVGGFVRSARADVRVEVADDGAVVALEVPRHGAGYEISWPSGNR